MENQKIKKSNLKELHDVACGTWKSKIESFACRNPFGDEVELTGEEINEMFEASDESQIKVVSEYFNKPKDLLSEINGFEDACKVLNIIPVFADNLSKDEIGFKKLKIIINALNNGWYPNFNDNCEIKYYNYFHMSNGVFAHFASLYTYTSMNIPSALYLRTRELATHCIKIAFNEYKDFYLG